MGPSRLKIVQSFVSKRDFSQNIKFCPKTRKKAVKIQLVISYAGAKNMIFCKEEGVVENSLVR